MRVCIFNVKQRLATITTLILSVAVNAAEKVPAANTETFSPFTSVLFIAMLGVSILLMLGIVGMAEMVKAGATLRNIRSKKEKNNNDVVKTIAFFFMISMSTSLHAQDATVPAPDVPFTYWGMGSTVFYSMLALIFVQAIIFYVLYRTGLSLLRNEEVAKQITKKRSWFFRSAVVRSVTEAITIEEEAALMMDHEYDGIRELDNNLPAWWKYGFYLTIGVAVIYLFHYHVIGTGPSSKEEYANEIKAAEQQIAEYKRSTANLVDETTVTRLTDPSALSAGRGVFLGNCTPCHGQKAEGIEGLGPNLTDDYWLHSGGTADIFKSIKYGWTDKGMKSWEQDLKPLEIQQIVSWIQSVRGSNPDNAKAPEGELYVDPADSVVADSARVDSVLTKSMNDTIKK